MTTTTSSVELRGGASLPVVLAAVVAAIAFTILVMRHIDGETPTPGDTYRVTEDHCYLTYHGPRSGVKGPDRRPVSYDVREYRCFR